jgi:dGTPase
MLGLNLDLIEAIALGHDVGHTPFGHAGERFLSELLRSETGRYFNHNVHSTRVLDILYRRNLSLQVLDGILCHNGEFELKEYRPVTSLTFEEYDKSIESCYTEGGSAIKKLIPSTLEGCVVRICDMIAYVGKDRQDAVTAGLLKDDSIFSTQIIGVQNAAMINNLTVDIVNNSYGKDCLILSAEAYNDLKTAKRENYEFIYNNPVIERQYEEFIKPMFISLYYKLLDDVITKNQSSVIYRHHINLIQESCKYYENWDYISEEPNQIVVDFIASMTDDYFIDLYTRLFPDNMPDLKYHSYFENLK